MDIDWQIAGHKKQLEFLANAIKRGKLAHAYIFAGPEGVGKKTVAFRLAQRLLQVTPPSIPPHQGEGRDFFHPDYLEVADEAGIKIEQIRELIYKLSLKPYQAKYKVAVIDNAENMTVEAANALLKNLEEPKSYTVMVLITSAPEKMLKTISSRAQKINFGPVAYEEYKHLLPGKVPEAQQKLIEAHALQSPGLALKIASDEEFLLNMEKLNDQFQLFRSKDEATRLSLVNELADLETPELRSAFDFWAGRLEQELRQNPTRDVAITLRSLISARSLLDLNANSKLMLTNLMLYNIGFSEKN